MADYVSEVTLCLSAFGIDVEPEHVSGVFSWCFQGTVYPVAITYDNVDQRLMLRIGPVADLTREEPAVAYRLLDSFMELNQWLLEGRYAGNEQVYFELPVSLSGNGEDIRDVISGLMVYTDLRPVMGLTNSQQAPRPPVDEADIP